MKNYNKRIAVSEETTYGNSSTTSADLIPRVSIGINENFTSQVSNEINFSKQESSIFRSQETVSASIESELRPLAFSKLIASFFSYPNSKSFLDYSTNINIEELGDNYLIAKVSGTFNSIKRYSIIRLQGINVINSNKNLLVLQVASNYLVVKVLNGSYLVPETNVTASIQFVGNAFGYLGSSTKSLTLESIQADTTELSEVYNGLVTTDISVNIASSALPRISFNLTGKGLKQKTNEQYFSSYVSSNDNIVTSNNAVTVIDDKVVAIQNANISMQRDTKQLFDTANLTCKDIKQGNLTVNITASIYIQDDTLYNKYRNKQAVGLCFVLPENTTKDTAFVSYAFNNCEIVSYEKSDDINILANVTFKALTDDISRVVAVQDSMGISLLWTDPTIWNDETIWYD